MIGIKHNETLQGIQPDLSRLKQLSAQTGCNSFFVFTLEKMSDDGPVHGRMFAPAIGIAEDPVTGNAVIVFNAMIELNINLSSLKPIYEQ